MNANTNPNLERENKIYYFIGKQDGKPIDSFINEFAASHITNDEINNLYNYFKSEEEAIYALSLLYDNTKNYEFDDDNIIYKCEICFIRRNGVLLQEDKSIVAKFSFNRKKYCCAIIF
jgi:hypothetical protein